MKEGTAAAVEEEKQEEEGKEGTKEVSVAEEKNVE